MKVKVKFLSHSGYFIETDKHIIVFDYIKGDLPQLDKTSLFVYSHSHQDHFSREILGLKGDVRFLLSSDIKEDLKLPFQDNVYYIGPDAKRVVGDVHLTTFGSTDKGISIFASVDNVGIFHSGDLNLWIWDEDSEDERLEMTRAFREEVKKVQLKNVDIAMFPLDPRLGRYASSGIDYFVDLIRPAYIFPMHMWEDFSISQKYKESFSSSFTKFVSVDHDNQEFIIEV
ncbi:MAG: MBL fold metallo-hydrolase [Bacillota bacterium]|nr:MBL fold metallo-hydrolase [Bacillota bacterium]